MCRDDPFASRPGSARPVFLPRLAVFLLLSLSTLPLVAEEEPGPLIRIVATGGTIANTASGRIPIQQTLADIRREFPETRRLLDTVRLDVVDLLRVGSQDFSGADFLRIVAAVNEAVRQENISGVIVTQGTYSTEETAYLLHLLVKSRKPVVIANSQRPHGTVGNDGDRNLVDAISVVLSPEAAGKGTLVVANQTINSAREVLKTSGRPGGFVSGMVGVLGVIESDGVTFYRTPTRRHTVDSEFDASDIDGLPKVEVISAYYDADPGMILAAARLGVEGIVINGFTNSGVPHRDQHTALRSLAERGIPIVLTARGGFNNRVGTGGWHAPFIAGDNLVAHKARLLLQLALTRTRDFAEIQRIFREY